MSKAAVRIAMWSGPRNISTAMMRSFENRDDTVVVDEPFYAHYLHKTGLDHPMGQEVIASQPIDEGEVIAQLFSDLPDGKSVFYQKHMTQHMLPGMDLSWLSDVTNCFLIRRPDEIVASYAEKRSTITEEDIGLERQFEIFELVTERGGQVPAVLDSSDVLKDPEKKLSKLCHHLEIPFEDSMLAWPPGRRDSDGVWAPHWYHNVEASTGFAPYRRKEVSLTPEHQAIADAGWGFYEKMKTHAL